MIAKAIAFFFFKYTSAMFEYKKIEIERQYKISSNSF